MITPTENKRINEMIGFVGLSLAVLLALSLLSYSPHDASFNVAARAPASKPASKWIGPVGAHISDLFFQFCGFSAFLFPVAMILVALRWFRSQLLEAPVAKLIGSAMVLSSFSAGMVLLHFPDVRGAVPSGGLLGTVLAQGLRAAFNPIGALLVTSVTFFTALFLTTSFSLRAAGAWLKKPTNPEGIFGKLSTRLKDWREERESQQLKKRVEEIKIAGRPAVAPQRVSASARETLPAVDEEEEETDSLDTDLDPDARVAPGPAVIKFHEQERVAPPPKKTTREPKIAHGKTSYRLPSPSLLQAAERGEKMTESELKEYARAIELKCQEFEVNGQVTQINPGPVVTTFEFKPEAGIKYSRITGLGDDLCLALRAESILIERIPGKSTVGIEVPNPHRETIALRDIVEAPEFSHSPSKLTMPLGKDLIGRIRAADLTQMPHLLIAGSTGTGKSVFINSLLMGMLYKATPEELKLVLVDPKQVELGIYSDIPHLLTPVVTDAKVAANVLRNATREMERRLKMLAGRSVRNIAQYNQTFQKGQSLSLFENSEEEEAKPLPYVVIVIAELADLMMVDTNGVEESITRLAQMARAVGIHLILATQRPSVDVITGLIKANFPARISFRVASKVDSRTILDSNGAEQLLGRGDMLFLPPGTSRLIRVHGAYIDETEISRIVNHIKTQSPPAYDESITQSDEEALGLESTGGEHDELFEEALRICVEMKRASTSVLKRRLRIGYGRAAAILDMMEREALIGAADGSRPRPVMGRAYEMVADWDEMGDSDQ